MITCPNCDFGNEEDDIFCANCGYNLEIKHTNIQTELLPIEGDAITQFQHLEDKIAELEGIEEEIHQAYQYHQSLKTESKGIETFYKQKQAEAKKSLKM
jgi:hypothetical protein